ncbi:MAG: TetR/AcrR family transcriptional regulator [Acidimicrobiia bacterium]|nr:TetR/AcrR family transcriptional regulator [Acidimicrobiia bacterium]
MPDRQAAPLEPNLRQPAPALGPRAQRTIESILDATREIFLTRGYGGTSINEITRQAGVSRASFYTYFPSKRDVLLSLGSGATKAARAAIAGLDDLPADWTVDDLESWLSESLRFLDTHGAFGLAWSQAAYEDPELREAGMRTHLRTCAMFGARLNAIRVDPLAEDTHLGLMVFSMLERTWTQQKLYEPTVEVDDVVRAGARLLEKLLR